MTVLGDLHLDRRVRSPHGLHLFALSSVKSLGPEALREPVVQQDWDGWIMGSWSGLGRVAEVSGMSVITVIVRSTLSTISLCAGPRIE